MNPITTVGDPTAVGAAAQTVATTKYSVGTAIKNKYGSRYAKITAKCDNAFALYVYGALASFASTANSGAASGQLLEAKTGLEATALDGAVYYVRCAGCNYVLPVLYQAGGDNATVTLDILFFND